jgi:ABC-type antimicrobial peptide transport system permease subunit
LIFSEEGLVAVTSSAAVVGTISSVTASASASDLALFLPRVPAMFNLNLKKKSDQNKFSGVVVMAASLALID